VLPSGTVHFQALGNTEVPGGVAGPVAIGHRTWTVLPHEPIEQLAPNLWRVEGVMGKSNRRVMTLVRLNDGRIVMHNAIALDEPSMLQIERWGEVSSILVPNSFHRQDAHIMQQRFPKAKVYAPGGALGAASKATACTGSYTDVPTDETLQIREIAGIGSREGVLIVHSDDGTSAIFCDTVLNISKRGGPIGFLLHPTGTLSVPRFATWFWAKDKPGLRDDLLSVADLPQLCRVIPGHGQIVAERAPERLREAAQRL
jgi:hypothetical protein